MGLSSQLASSSLARPGVCTSSTRPASPYEGQVIYETDTDKVLVWNGSAWYANWNLPWGLVAAPITWATNSKIVNTASPSALLGTITFNAVNNRYYRINWLMDIYQTASAGFYLHLYVNGSFNTALAFSNSAMWGNSYVYRATATASLSLAVYGVHNSGSGSTYFGSVMAPQISVEDIGVA